jgi:glycerophosphoryl diester phosphodiesterase
MMKKPQVVARCGDLVSAPESTLPAFEQAIAKGADAVEFDVHLTKDGELVIHHDFYLGRTNNGRGYIGDFSLAELKALDAGSWFGSQFAGEKIPTLGEVLALGKGRIRFEIDMKGSSLAFLNRLIAELSTFDVLDQIELTSAHTPLLIRAKEILPDIHTGIFFYPLPEWMQPDLGQQHILDWMTLSHTQVAHLHSSLLAEEFVARLWENGFLVHGSNLNTQEEIEKGIELGIDQFSTDRLEFALGIVEGSR